MGLEVFYQNPEPLIIDLGDSQIVLKNLNDLTIPELHKMSEEMKVASFYKDVFSILILKDESNSFQYLTRNNFIAIIDELENISEFKIGELLEIFKLIEENTIELQRDLSELTHIKTVSELFTLKPVDFVNVIKSIIKFAARESWVIANINDWQRPFSTRYNLEDGIKELAMYTANLMQSKLIKIPPFKPMDKIADNLLKGLTPLDEDSALTQKQQDDAIQRWRETGKLDL